MCVVHEYVQVSGGLLVCMFGLCLRMWMLDGGFCGVLVWCGCVGDGD